MIKSERVPYLLSLLMLAACAGAYFLTPRLDAADTQPALATAIPTAFGDWHVIATPEQVVDPTNEHGAKNPLDSAYDDVLMRAYENTHGKVILLAVAYGRHQRQEFKIHRPELCYVAQGFRLLRHDPVVFPITDSRRVAVTGSRMMVQSPVRVEIISYWIRIGDRFTANAWATRYYLLKKGIGGHVLDGVLVRASQVVSSADDATPDNYGLQEQFLSDLVQASSPAGGHLLIG